MFTSRRCWLHTWQVIQLIPRVYVVDELDEKVYMILATDNVASSCCIKRCRPLLAFGPISDHIVSSTET